MARPAPDRATLMPKSSKPEQGIGGRMHPQYDCVFVEPFEVGEKIGNIYLADQTRGTAVIGRVFAVGPGTPKWVNGEIKWMACECKVGDYVMYDLYSGRPMQFEWEGKVLEFLAFRDASILAKVSYD